MQLALRRNADALRGRFRLPPAVPPFNTLGFRLFSLLWFAAFLLAVGGPIAGMYLRATSPPNNSQLLLGSRAGFAVARRDATLVRFTVGPQSSKAGIGRGDHIVAIYGLPLPRVMPVDERTLAEHSEDPAYIAMGNLLFGSDSSEIPLTVRDPGGRIRDVTVTTGENHIDAGARAIGISPTVLSFIDILHVISYPFLLWAAWILHRRNSRDVVSSLLSLAVLLTIAAEHPSSELFIAAGIPRSFNVAIYDLGNILLLTGILLFPHGDLSWRRVALIAALPVLLFLQGTTYQLYFVACMVLAVLMLTNCLRVSTSAEQRQQIRWALLGISGYAAFRLISILCDYFKWSAGSFPHQMLLEMSAGIAFAVAVLLLQFGLLIALLRYRLYDAEIVISRSANVALITLVIVAVFAAVADGLKQLVYDYYGNTNDEAPVLIAAALSTVLINPVQERIQRWSERRFQRNLFLLRDDLPECVRDLRETASLEEMADEVLERVDRGVRAVRSALIVDGRPLRARGIEFGEVEGWRVSRLAQDYKSDICEPADRLFPIRVPLIPSSDDEAPIGYLLVGPRPDGSVPSRDEQEALAGVSEAVARAIRTVIRREAREVEVARTIERNAQRIEAIERLLSKSRRGPRPGVA